MMVHAEIADRLRRARKNNKRVHFDQVHVRALMAPQFYRLLAELESKELNALCQQDNALPPPPSPSPSNATSLVRTGSGIAAIEEPGPSVGSKVEQRAADALLSQEVQLLTRRAKHKTH